MGKRRLSTTPRRLFVPFLFLLIGLSIGNLVVFIATWEFEPTDSFGHVSSHGSPSILCWAPTAKEDMNAARAVMNTWGRHCDSIVFVTSSRQSASFVPGIPFLSHGPSSSHGLPIVGVVSGDGYQNLWQKTSGALKKIHSMYIDKFDWFLKCEVDTFVVVENLKTTLRKYSPSDPVALGHLFNHDYTNYLGGGAGYVLSKQALRSVVMGMEEGIGDCAISNSQAEDIQLGRCLDSVEVKMIDSGDEQGIRMYPINTYHFLENRVPDWMSRSVNHYNKSTYTWNLSPSLSTMHGPKGWTMQSTYYLTYVLRVFGKK